MKIQVYIYNRWKCPYRDNINEECAHEDALKMDCNKDGELSFPTGCPLVALRIKQTNDSIKFIE